MDFDSREYNWPHRTYCDVLHEMRKILDSMNSHTYDRSKALLGSMVEELQVYGNRMEAGLSFSGDLTKLHEERKKIRTEIKKLKEEIADVSVDL